MTFRSLVATLVALLALAGCETGSRSAGPGAQAVASAPADTSARAELRGRMDAFLEAVRGEDAAAFARMFSRERPWRYVLNVEIASPDTVHASRQVTEVAPERLRRDLETKGEYHSYFLDPGNRGVGSVGFVAEQGASWKLLDGGRFVPDGSDEGSSTWVKWRREGGRWVVDEIAEWYH